MTRTIDLDHITKIEGHASLSIKIAGGKVERAELTVFEGARYFEGILKGKKFEDISHVASRICGICSVVHSITSIEAIESAFGVGVSRQTKLLRELLNIGGIIQSHVLHLYFLVLPDYAGAGSALELAKTERALIDRALRIKKAGNSIVNTIAGRDIHPIACVVGGFSRLPDTDKLKILLEDLNNVREDALETVKLFNSLSYPAIKRDRPYFSLSGKRYFASKDLIRCDKGECFPPTSYTDHFKEYLREGSTSEFATQEEKSYLVGAIARVNNNKNLLKDDALRLAERVLDERDNPFMNVPAQAIEILAGIDRSIEILQQINIEEEKPASLTVRPCACEGTAAWEAPRGTLFHRYKFDKEGRCTFADITTPTTQNLQHIEESIKEYLPSILSRNPDEIKNEIEKLIRAYDPCISCSTHFLELEIESD